MCEPYGSVIQAPEDDNQGGVGPRTASILGKFAQWGKKIGNWFHFSRMGHGHSEALSSLRGDSRLLIFGSSLSNWEVGWWDRSVKFDNWVDGSDWDFINGKYMPRHPSEEMKEALEIYANKTSIGNLHLLRQFLETSMLKSPRPAAYAEILRDCFLNEKGRVDFEKRVKNIFPSNRYRFMGLPKHLVPKMIGFCLGYTRKRNFLVPEWADDNGLWKGSSGQGSGIVVPG